MRNSRLYEIHTGLAFDGYYPSKAQCSNEIWNTPINSDFILGLESVLNIFNIMIEQTISLENWDISNENFIMGNEGVWNTINNWTKANWSKFTKWLKYIWSKIFKGKKDLEKAANDLEEIAEKAGYFVSKNGINIFRRKGNYKSDGTEYIKVVNDIGEHQTKLKTKFANDFNNIIKKHLQKEDFSKLNKEEKIIKSCDRISDAMNEFKKLHWPKDEGALIAGVEHKLYSIKWMINHIKKCKEALKKAPKGNESDEIKRIRQDMNDSIKWLEENSQDSLAFYIQDLLRNIK